MKDGIHPTKDNPCKLCKFEKSCRYSTEEYEVEDCGEWVAKERDSDISI